MIIIWASQKSGASGVVWILTTGFWNDAADWIDTENWND